ncbi:MAG: polyprenol monophosphomannose synthase [Thermoplasmata archaeon]
MGAGVEVTVILPTLNERACLEALRPRLEAALAPYPAEVLVVDDNSPDGTAGWVRDRVGSGPWRLLLRDRPRGLASAVVEGIAQARGELLVVMDADGSHPPELLPKLLDPLRSGRAEFVLASRFAHHGSDPGLGPLRRAISWSAASLARPLTAVTDPMSGFFSVTRTVTDRAALAPFGYKIALEILVRCRPSPIEEVPYVFTERMAGVSKLGGRQVLGYVGHLARLYRFRYGGGGAAGRASRTR